MGWIRVNSDDGGSEEFREGFVSEVGDLAAFVAVADDRGQGVAGEVGPT